MFKRLISLVAIAIIGLSVAAEAPAQATPNTATISFTRPTQYADGSSLDATVAVTYGLYQGIKGQAKTKVATISAVSNTVNTGLASGQTYCWSVSAIANGIEGDLSLEACKTFPFGKPGTVTITVQ